MRINLPPTIAANIDQFTGRTWLLPKILEWYEDSRERLLLLTGGPGTGKSMIMAWLAGHGALPEEEAAREQLVQIRAQVKAAHFCIAASGETDPRALAKNLAEQLTSNVRGFADALTASLAELVRIEGVARAGTAMPGATLTGVQIGTLNLAGLGEELSFNRTLREPLKTLYKNGHDKPLLILVDALDEALTYTGVTDIVRLLAKLKDLPKPVRFLVSARPDPRVLKRFRGARRVDLIEDAPPDVDDVQAYASGRLEKVEGLSPSKVGAFASRMAKAADGIFLYAAIVLNDLLLRLPDIGDLEALPFPEKLQGLYHSFLLRVLDSDDPQWYSLFRPVLGLIAVAQGEGLSRAQLEWLIGQETEYPLRLCKQFLQGDLPQGPFRCFHRSFVEYLLEDEENVDYHIDGVQMHRWIADSYRSRYHDDWSECDGYGLRHLPAHLSAARRMDGLQALLLDLGFLEAVVRGIGAEALMPEVQAASRLLPEATELLTLRWVLRRELANLTRWLSESGPSFFSQQVLNRAKVAGYAGLADRAAKRLVRLGSPYLKLLWKASNQSPEREQVLGRVPDDVTSIVLTPDGARVVFATPENTLYVWEIDSMKRSSIPGTTTGLSPGKAYDLAISDDGRLVVTVSFSFSRLWDLEEEREIRNWRRGAEQVAMVQMSTQAFTINRFSSPGLLDFEAKDEMDVQIVTEKATALAVLPGGDHVVIAQEDGTFVMCDLATGRVRRWDCGHGSVVRALAVTPDGRWLISAGGDANLKVWDLNAEELVHTLTGHEWSVTAVAAFPDSQRAVSGSADHTLRVWNLETGREARTLYGHDDKVRDVAVSADGMRIVSLDEQKKILIWDIQSLVSIQEAITHTADVNEIKVVPGGRYAVSASRDGTLRIWDMKDLKDPRKGRVLGTPDAQRPVVCVAPFPDGTHLLSGDGHGWLHVWDVGLDQAICRQRGHKSLVWMVSITDDGRQAVSASMDTTLIVWAIDEGEEGWTLRPLYTLEGHEKEVTGVAISAANRWILSVSKDETVRAWELDTGRPVCVLGKHPDEVLSVVTTPDGRTAISSAADGSMRIWDLVSGGAPRVLAGHTGRTWGLAVSPSGRHLASASWDNTIRVWDLTTGHEISMMGLDVRAACTSFISDSQIVLGDHLGSVTCLRLVS